MSEVRFWDIENGERVADFHGEEDYGFGDGALSRTAVASRWATLADSSSLTLRAVRPS